VYLYIFLKVESPFFFCCYRWSSFRK